MPPSTGPIALPAENAEIQTAIDEAKQAVEGGDPETMNAKAQTLAQAAMKLGQAIYEKEQASAAAGGADDASAAQGAQAGGSDEERLPAQERSRRGGRELRTRSG